MKERKLDVSIVMPCLNEAKTVGYCVDDALAFIGKMSLTGEVIVVDNGSDDLSAITAREHGAGVITERRKGYGRAIRTGIHMCHGHVIIIGDCDMTYDFYRLKGLYKPLSTGKYDVMIGNRLGNMEPGAMSLSHKVGVRILSFLGRIRYRTKVKDFHCGLRGMTHDAAGRMRLRTDGMEFATEMIAQATRNHMKIGQTNVVLKKCPYGRESKLRTIRDGFRHLKYILIGKI